ncbi:MAG: shikimate kinase [Candidatus Omnitrophica bacterium]|nr:shikimate kinase [Candidatus Omnitrophota bacterium]MBU1926018.1 shikimate kinase [Candidatus Omnitrophota bacterium]
MKKNIVLVGFMGTGKTTVARILAQKLKRQFVDLDDIIENGEGRTIADIFREKGQAYFRKIEKDAVCAVSKNTGMIIACGGGVVLDSENVSRLKDKGVMICLTATAEVISERTKSFSHRPLLNTDEAKTKIEELLKARKADYAKADHTIDTSSLTVEQVAEKILKAAGEKKK